MEAPPWDVRIIAAELDCRTEHSHPLTRNSPCKGIHEIRIGGKQAFLTIKGRSNKFSRLEFEYEIPTSDAEIQLDCLCERPLIEKTRYDQKVGDHVWVIDIFRGDSDGLIVAEIELSIENEKFDRPLWLGEEVSDDPWYFNSNLSKTPFKSWKMRA